MHAGFFALRGICDVIKPRLHPYPRSSLRSRTTEKLRNVTKPRRVSPPKRRKKVQSFSSATCAAKKILLRLQVWNLCAGGAQIMRAADCKPLCQKGILFDSRQTPAIVREPVLRCGAEKNATQRRKNKNMVPKTRRVCYSDDNLAQKKKEETQWHNSDRRS